MWSEIRNRQVAEELTAVLCVSEISEQVRLQTGGVGMMLKSEWMRRSINTFHEDELDTLSENEHEKRKMKWIVENDVSRTK